MGQWVGSKSQTRIGVFLIVGLCIRGRRSSTLGSYQWSTTQSSWAALPRLLHLDRLRYPHAYLAGLPEVHLERLLLQDFLNEGSEHLLDVLSVPRAHLPKHQVICLCKQPSLLCIYLPRALQIDFVAHQHYLYLLMGCFLDVIQIVLQAIERVFGAHIVDKQRSHCALVVHAPNGFEDLGPSSIIEVHSDCLICEIELLLYKVNSDGVSFLHGALDLLGEFLETKAFSDGAFPDVGRAHKDDLHPVDLVDRHQFVLLVQHGARFVYTNNEIGRYENARIRLLTWQIDG